MLRQSTPSAVTPGRGVGRGVACRDTTPAWGGGERGGRMPRAPPRPPQGPPAPPQRPLAFQLARQAAPRSRKGPPRHPTHRGPPDLRPGSLHTTRRTLPPARPDGFRESGALVSSVTQSHSHTVTRGQTGGHAGVRLAHCAGLTSSIMSPPRDWPIISCAGRAAPPSARKGRSRGAAKQHMLCRVGVYDARAQSCA